MPTIDEPTYQHLMQMDIDNDLIGISAQYVTEDYMYPNFGKDMTNIWSMAPDGGGISTDCWFCRKAKPDHEDGCLVKLVGPNDTSGGAQRGPR